MILSDKVIIIIAISIVYLWYIVIMRRKNQVLEALSGVEVQLTKRSELIPNILKIAKKFMEHEKEIFIEVTALREKIFLLKKHKNIEEINEYFKLSNEIAKKMSSVIMQIENYPNLKSDQSMLQAQQIYSELEENISAARRFYNSLVTEYNNVTQIFPGNLIAKLARADKYPFYKDDEEQTKIIDADKILK